MGAADINICKDQDNAQVNAEINLCPDQSPAVDFEIQLCQKAPGCPGERQFRIDNVGDLYFLGGGIPPYFRWDESNKTWISLGGDVQLPSTPVDCPINYTYKDTCDATLTYAPPVNSHAELTLSGTDEPEVGDIYTASGGVAPYTWSFSGGTIDSSGEITTITGCGVATVSVSDACGYAANIVVRLPGFWSAKPESEWWYSDCYFFGNDTFVAPVEVIVGADRWLIYFQHGDSQSTSFSTSTCGLTVCDGCDSFQGYSCARNITYTDYFGSGGSSYYCWIIPAYAVLYKWECV